MGYNFADLVNEKMRIYTYNGYVSLRFYVAERSQAVYIANILGGRFSPHRKIFEVAVSDRASLLIASRRLLLVRGLTLGNLEKLKLVKEYAQSDTREQRTEAVHKLRT